jgi:hypothetical protein
VLKRITERIKGGMRRVVKGNQIPTPDKLAVSGLKMPERVFFIVGHPKSGTTWLSKILDKHPEVRCNFEGHFFKRDDGLETLSSVLNSSEELRHWATRDFNNWSRDFDEELLYLKKLIIQLYLQLDIHRTGKLVIGDKSPGYQLEEMYRLFPDAKLINIIRDGRDVTVSMAFHIWDKQNPYIPPEMMGELCSMIEGLGTSELPRGLPDGFVAHIASTWKKEVEMCRNDGKKLFGRNYFELRYEDLHADPTPVIKKLFDHLKVRTSSGTVKTCLKKTDFKILTGGRERGFQDHRSFWRKGIVGDWKNVFDEKNIATFRDIAGELLDELGY